MSSWKFNTVIRKHNIEAREPQECHGSSVFGEVLKFMI